MNDLVLLRYSEIGIKGGNRRWFENTLAKNVKKIAEKNTGENKVFHSYTSKGRIYIETQWGEDTRLAIEKVFGISSFSPIFPVPTDLDQIEKICVDRVKEHFENRGIPKNFRVEARRSEKVISDTSPQINERIGSAIRKVFPGLEVSLQNPQFTLGIEIRKEESFIWLEKFPGPGGLPMETNGHLLSLISGGIDSPVATVQVMKRGSTADYIHFHGAPFVSPASLNKVEDLVRIIQGYSPSSRRLIVVPFGKIQEKIALSTNPKVRTLLYRRMMFRIASHFAKEMNALGLVTGESIGQVASQTIENLAVTDDATSLPVIRPLISHDKEEIVRLAEKWKTYATSIEPGEDCCTLFADRHPATRANLEGVREQETLFPVEELIQEGVDSAEIRKLR